VDDRDFAYFGQEKDDRDEIGFIDANTRAIFGRSYIVNPMYWPRNSPETRRLPRQIPCL
jgi:hypothetical protein